MIAVRLVALLAVLIAISVAARADNYGWDTYANARYGYSIKVPFGLYEMQPAPENNDGRSFQTRDGRSHLVVYGSYNALDQTPEQYAAFLAEDQSLGRVTYRVIRKDWLVLSGFRPSPFSDGDPEQIFYLRVMFNRDHSAMSAFEITYPTGQKQRFDPIVKRLAETLTPPRTE